MQMANGMCCMWEAGYWQSQYALFAPVYAETCLTPRPCIRRAARNRAFFHLRQRPRRNKCGDPRLNTYADIQSAKNCLIFQMRLNYLRKIMPSYRQTGSRQSKKRVHGCCGLNEGNT